ncbi:dihydrolipoyl dehydrogenase [Alkalibacter saccharofermentans]|uniref:Dihydrolipoyl dehydrogenase n=1 Tax=Alkalibacter saccharofermentans DSM 14828 TaxID=1120975 RepID=A0A1M4VZB8_9FIRM|nr:dihydrolipoyl dehydrogenase [Alkalibacter saccharofermentans]SHE74328.1 dihydrolipoamide dehydrogenase [Alkalibacter saccharofermentans DSM 14828]
MYDLIVVGGGPAGYISAERAGHGGLKTLLIEKASVGGVCLNEGCVPSKTLLHSAKIYDYAKGGEKYGVCCKEVSYDQDKVIDRKDGVVKKLVGGVKAALKANNVELLEADAHIKGKDKEGFLVEAGGQVYKAKYLLIATGSGVLVPPIPGLREGLDEGAVLTNKEILSLREIPESLVVIGGGVIGLEMASYYNSVGSKVTVVEMLEKIAGQNDEELSRILQGNLKSKGIEFILGAKVTKVDGNKVVFEKEGKEREVSGSKILLSIGRRPTTEGIGLENISVNMKRGAVVTDEQMKTNIPGVYAAGDVNGKSMLAHTAYREGEVAINNILGKKDIMRYQAVPSVIYTHPEVASVGETESTAKDKGLDFTVKKISNNYSGRYMAENERGDGITKILIDNEYDRIIGVQIIGSYASEIIYGAGLMIETELPVGDIKELVFPHPTVSEVIREALFS